MERALHFYALQLYAVREGEVEHGCLVGLYGQLGRLRLISYVSHFHGVSARFQVYERVVAVHVAHRARVQALNHDRRAGQHLVLRVNDAASYHAEACVGWFRGGESRRGEHRRHEEE